MCIRVCGELPMASAQCHLDCSETAGHDLSKTTAVVKATLVERIFDPELRPVTVMTIACTAGEVGLPSQTHMQDLFFELRVNHIIKLH